MPHTIAACATARAPSAVGIIRISGEDCFQIAQNILELPQHALLSGLPDRKLVLCSLYDADRRLIDHPLVTVSHSPHSYTGENTCEIHCHGSPAVLNAALQALYSCGAQPARAGEFTERAFLNGRMDLTQAEAVADLIDAETAGQAANAADQLSGALRRRIEPVYSRLTDIMAHFHAVLDYPDEEIEPFELDNYRSEISSDLADLQELLRTFRRGSILKNGVTAVLIGRPNAGKSSLMNVLAGFERVIVSDIPGTTRDTVEHAVNLNGTLFRVIDTAGIRSSSDPIEAMGSARSEDAAKNADLAIYLFDRSAEPDPEDLPACRTALTAKHAVCCANKCDLPAKAGFPAGFEAQYEISCRTGAGIEAFISDLSARYGAGSCSGTVLTNARQAAALQQACDALCQTLTAIDDGLTPDAVLVGIEDAMQSLGELNGRVMRDEIISRIFSRFCVGK